MPPKKGGKGKGKKQDDDEKWEKAEQSVKPLAPAVEPEEDDVQPSKPSKRGFASGFAGLSLDEPSGGGDGGSGDEEEDFGGLMSAIKSSAAKPKKEKKRKDKKRWDDDDDMGETIPPSVGFADGPGPGEGSDGEAAAARGDITTASHGQEMTAEELADLEFGPAKGKKSKGKKASKKGKAAAEDEDGAQAAETEPTTEPADAPADDVADDDAEGGGKVLSKKEKERLKKEREKEKKKEEAAKKKKELDEIAALVATSTPAAPAPEKDATEAAEGTAQKTGGKKKKKKGATEEAAAEEAKPEPKASAPAAGPPKKVSAKVAALRAAMEAQRIAQEEAERKAEEEKKRIEEEEKRAAEEEKRREEEKLRRKEKEKAKKEQARKEGKLLTDKQKRDKAAAEVRRQALLASGVKIAALEEKEEVPAAPKKFSYAKKGGKKPGTSAVNEQAATSAPQSPALTESTLAEPVKVPPSESPKSTAKESWEESESDPEKPAAVAPDVKKDWDASSDEADDRATTSKPPVAKPAPSASKPAAATKSSNGSTKGPTTKAAPPSKPSAASGKGTTPPKPTSTTTPAKEKAAVPTPAKSAPAPSAAKEESSSEEQSDEDSDDDSDESDSDEESSSDEERMTAAQRDAEKRKAEAAARRAERLKQAMASRSKNDLRSPICCILGHVDTGKTKLLDKIRQTNVQEGEAGGITQQIGATYFPVDAIREKTKVLPTSAQVEYNIPGLLIIDTPGHESFTNLRSRGSSLCNIAVLVVDIMHGLEPQTLESLRLLRDKKIPFIVALNKIDRMYGWEKIPDNAFQDSLAKQKTSVQKEFETRCTNTILAFAEQGLNAKLYYENDNPGRIVSLVPTSAVTGEGVPDMIMLLVKLTQERMSDKLMYISELECTVLEVKVIEGLGTTIDVVLSNGWLHEGDRIVVCGLNGPIVTNIRALLTPQPLREMRIKGAYVHLKEVKGALGVKITAQDLEKAIAGSRLLVVGPDDDEDELREEVMSDLTNLLNYLDKSGRGVCVQASTLGSLEALLEFLKVSKIPVSGINIGPVHKKDVMRSATMLEKAKELACILCFDVPVDKDAERMAEEMGIRLFKADIIYHLFDAFTAYNNEITEAKRRDAAPQAVWPCRLKIIACFAKRDPIILGVDILEGTLRIGTPLCVIKADAVTGKKEIIHLGKITSLEINHKTHEIIKKSQAGAGVAVKIEHAIYEPARMYGRHFDDKDEVISQITRSSIDVLKDNFRADVPMEEWGLIKQLKVRLGLP
ncbi:hypothetical protein FRB95_005036 [Tulasnella sp. JGI-2019a]|nr:hypothetical protein FRB95_005036 [Tulasnella sp. JGI-2019a]